MLSLWSVVTTILSAYYFFKRRKSEVNENKNVFSSAVPRITAWILFDIVFGASCLVMILFWVFLYDPDYDESSPGKSFRAWNGHLVNFLIPLIDFIYHRIPIRILHSVYPVVYGFIYLMFTAIYYAESKKYVYSILDWAEKPGKSTGIALASIVAVIVFQFVFYSFHRLKLKLMDGKSTTAIPNGTNKIVWKYFKFIVRNWHQTFDTLIVWLWLKITSLRILKNV